MKDISREAAVGHLARMSPGLCEYRNSLQRSFFEDSPGDICALVDAWDGVANFAMLGAIYMLAAEIERTLPCATRLVFSFKTEACDGEEFEEVDELSIVIAQKDHQNAGTRQATLNISPFGDGIFATDGDLLEAVDFDENDTRLIAGALGIHGADGIAVKRALSERIDPDLARRIAWRVHRMDTELTEWPIAGAGRWDQPLIDSEEQAHRSTV